MSKLLIVVVIVLAVIAIAQLTRLYELSRTLRGTREEKISLANNKLNAWFMLLFMFLFYGFFIWLVFAYGDQLLPEAASVEGEIIDKLMDFNLVLVSAIFFLTNTLLFWFSFKYYHREDRKALFYPHNNKLELIWTIIPSIVLAIVIIYGLKTWNDITDDASPDAMVVELYSRQFDWTARYPGADNKLGKASYNFISGANPLGIITSSSYQTKLQEVEKEITETEFRIKNGVMSDEDEQLAEVKLRKLKAQKLRILALQNNPAEMVWGEDDKVVKAEFHIPVGKEIKFIFRSQDVIHSAYMPHFRAQMNTVPGMTTTYKFTPTITTEEMRAKLDNPNFNYILLCNKICGAAHYNMQMNIVVESEADYRKWLASQKNFHAPAPAPADSTAAPVAPAVSEDSTTTVAVNN